MTEAIALIKENAVVPNGKVNGKSSKLVTWTEFERKYLDRKDDFKYEWNNGIIAKTQRSVRPKQKYIVLNLLKLFLGLKNLSPNLGWLMEESDIFLTTGKHKRPDIAYFLESDLIAAAETDKLNSRFVIELISETYRSFDTQSKIKEYFEGGVEVVWHIFPNLKEVVIYRHDQDFSQIVRGKNLCSAETIIEGFIISAEDIFKK